MTTARTATPSTARAINDRLALDLLLERGPLTASDLRTLTGLSRPTVADLLERLQRAGLVAHAGESAALRRGPNARLYSLVADRAHLAGIDIRATGVSLVVADLTGRTLKTATIAASVPDDDAVSTLPAGNGAGRGDGARRGDGVARSDGAGLDDGVGTGGGMRGGSGGRSGDAEAGADLSVGVGAGRETGGSGGADSRGAADSGGTDGDRLVERTVETLLAAVAEAGARELHTVAVGAPGLVDPATGALNNSGKLPEWHTKLLAALRSRPGTEVILENEVNLAGIAEHRIGAARGRQDFALIWLGHGVGASVVLDGKLRRGASGGTGEIGFLPVPGTIRLPDSKKCDGGFHSLVSSAAICELAAHHGLKVETEGLEPLAESVVRLAVETGAEDFLDELAQRIALGASAICVVLDPGCVVLGGEIGQAGGPELAERVERHLSKLSPLATEVRAGTAGGSAVLAGAVLTAGDAVRRELFGGL